MLPSVTDISGEY